MSAEKSWLDTKDIWIQETELHSIVGEVLVIEAHVNIKCLWSWVFWNLDFHSIRVKNEFSVHEDLVSNCVCESCLNLTAVPIIWADKVLSINLKIEVLWILGNSVGWVDSSNSWTIEVSYLMANVLPVLAICRHFHPERTNRICLWSNALKLAISHPGHISWLVDIVSSSLLFKPALEGNIIVSSIIEHELIELHTSEYHWRISSI